MNPRLKPLVFIIAALSASSAFAETTLDPVIVTANRQPMRASEVLADVSVIEREDLANAGQSTIAEVLARQPGIEITTNGGAGSTTAVLLRGGATSKHTLVLIDGQRVGSATSGDFSWSRLPVEQIERIEILRGPASSLYGSDAIGGVVQIFTRQGSGAMKFNAEIGGESRYNTQAMSAGVSGSTGAWSYSLQGSTYNTLGFNNMNTRANLAYGDKDGYKNQSISGNLAYAFSPDHKLALTILQSGGASRSDTTSTSLATAARDYRNEQELASYQLTSTNRLASNWLSTLRIGRGIDDYRYLTNAVLSSTYKTQQDQFMWQNDVRLGLGSLLVALERLEQKISSSSTFTQKERSNNSLVLGWSASVSQHSWQTSLRRDDNSQFGGKTTGGVSYGYRITPTWRVQGSYATAFKAPSFNDLYYPLDSFGYMGNANLKPETAHNKEIAAVYQANGQKLSITLFENRINNLISWSGRTSPINIGNAKLSGETLSYSSSLAGFDVMASYTHQKAIDADSGKRLPRRAKDFATLTLGKQFGVLGIQAEVQANGQRYDTDANTRSLAGYTLFNLAANYALNKEWTAFARFNNVFNKKYELAADYATPGANLFVGVRYAPK